ncbi:MAG: flagellar filament capping protein FliD [Acidobacteriota bacterium]
MGSVYTPVGFSGISKYSSDFQSVLTRSSAIAAIPITALTNKNSDIASQGITLAALNSAVAALGTDLTNIGQLSSGLALTASTTDATAVTATITGATSGASYSVTNITSVAAAASETSSVGYANGTSATVSSTGTLRLLAGSNDLTFTLGTGANNLVGIASAINALNAGVTASVLTTGSGAHGTYLSITANSPGLTTLKLIDNPAGAGSNILTATNQGANSIFTLNGIAVNSPSTRVSGVIPGVTLNILGKTTADETVGVTVATDTSKISAALKNLVDGYNTVAKQVNAQIGPAAGLLSGNNVIYQIRQAMSAIVHYQGSGGVANLANLGIEVGGDGLLSLNQTTFAALSETQIAASFALFGSATTGLGSLKTAFTAISDPVSGTIATQLAADTVTTARVTAEIAKMSARIAVQQSTLLAQLQAADALVAILSSQQSLLSSSISSLQFTSYGYQSQQTAGG